ncbi:hypothetical protein [Hymenobacter coalescens]
MSFLLLGGLLTASACSKQQDPEPTPTLEGSWNKTRTIGHNVAPDGTLTPWFNSPHQPGTLRLELTGSEWISRQSRLSTADTYTYTRSGDTLIVNANVPGSIPNKMLIVEHTPRSLHLRWTDSKRTVTYTDYYTR